MRAVRIQGNNKYDPAESSVMQVVLCAAMSRKLRHGGIFYIAERVTIED